MFPLPQMGAGRSFCPGTRLIPAPLPEGVRWLARTQRRGGGSRSPFEAAGAVGSVESLGHQPSIQASVPLLAEIRRLGWLPQAGREPQVSWFPACCLDLAFMEAHQELLASEGEELGEGEGKS